MTQSPQGARPADNLRVRRTKLLLREALIELIEERGFESLTIGELTERAMVSRAAFYRNYQDKYDLVEQIFEEAMSALLNAVGELGREHPAEIWVQFFEHIASYDRLYRALLGSSGSPWFVRKMRVSLAGLVKERGRLPHGRDARLHPVRTFSACRCTLQGSEHLALIACTPEQRAKVLYAVWSIRLSPFFLDSLSWCSRDNFYLYYRFSSPLREGFSLHRNRDGLLS